MADEIDKVLSKGEKVLWRGKPVKTPYLIAKALGIGSSRGTGLGASRLLAPLITIVVMFCIFSYLSQINSKMTGRQNYFSAFFPALGVWNIIFYLLLLAIIIILLRLAWALLSYDYVAYAVTNQRVVIQSGFVGRDFKSVSFNQVTNPVLDVNWLGTRYGAGNVILGFGMGFSTRAIMQRYVLEWVPQPYEVLKMVNQATKSAPVTRFIK